ncbi:MAG TPA: hypothetical protein VGX68_15590 [Thermoanaerobaculia bacterium]|jgi:hypothetical protein|nr:hypothetical protein [Thermoanaerobaculia bacterium]
MNRETTYKGLIGDLERLVTALLANSSELPQLEGVRLHLEQILEATRATAQLQAELVASKQDASRRLLRLMGDGAREVTAVRKLLKAHYGLDAEKLAEFGIQPFRGRSRRLAAGLPPSEVPTPEIARPADPPDPASSES